MSPTPAAEVPDRPYPGIEAFNYADHAVFFAREEESDKLLRSVTVYRGVLVYGASGAGKSSLINAGFLPRARSEGFTPERIRLQPRTGQEIIVERISLNSESGPPYLSSSFASEDDIASRQVLSIGEFRAKIIALQPSNRFPVLIFDQFEEFVSLFEEALQGEAFQAARRVQTDLLDLIVSLYRDSDLHVKLIFVFREDYLAKLGKLFNRCPDLRDVFLHITAPRPAALEQIILGPFRRFPGRFSYEFPETLAKRLQFAFEERSDSSELNLSEVQIACQRLWSSVDQEQEFARKGLRGLLEDYLADSLRRLPVDLHEPAVALLSRMVTEGGLRNVISEHDLISLVVSEERLRRECLKAALGALVADTRLVCRERRADVVFFEIVSEFLVPWIGRQKALRHARAQRRRWIVAATVMLVIAVGSLGATFWVLQKRTEAAIAQDEVRRSRVAENAARVAAQKAQLARAHVEDELANVAASRRAAASDAEEMRKEMTRVRPQQVLQKELDRLNTDAARLRAEHARLLQNARIADITIANQRQELESIRNRPFATGGSSVNGPPGTSQNNVLTGTLRAGELKVFTGAAFDAGVAFFIMESDETNPVDAGLAVVATTENSDTWQTNLRQATNDLRNSAKRLFGDVGTTDLSRRQAAVESVQKRVSSQLRQSLPQISGVYSSIRSKFPNGPRGADVQHTVTFQFKDATYELRLRRQSQNEFAVVLSRVGPVLR